MTGVIRYQNQKWLLLIVVLLGICAIGKIYKLIEPQQKYEINAKIHQTFKSMAARADGENIPFMKEQNFPSNTPTPIPPNISKSHLKIFDSFRYEEEMKTRFFERDACVSTRLVPSFMICVYQKSRDIFVSDGILRTGSWEPHISVLIKSLLQVHSKSDIVFVDVGANLGIHGLYAAKLGYKVWAIEPQPDNLVKMFRSALMSGLIDRIKFVQNGVGEQRRNASMNINLNNNGGSFVEVSNSKIRTNEDDLRGYEYEVDMNMDYRGVSLEIILLSDIFQDIKSHTNHKPKGVVMKMDIEQFECRSFLGSPELLRHAKNQTSSDETLPILAIIMEWTFLSGDPNGDRCPKEHLVELTKLFLENDYTPFRVTEHLEKLNITHLGLDWHTDVLWVYKYSNFQNVSDSQGVYKLSFDELRVL